MDLSSDKQIVSQTVKSATGHNCTFYDTILRSYVTGGVLVTAGGVDETADDLDDGIIVVVRGSGLPWRKGQREPSRHFPC